MGRDATAFQIEPFFLPFGQESLFCIYLAPTSQKAQAGIVFVPPFAEEMHKSRRMTALQARHFARQGYAVLQFDLLGCGDSTGDFEDASWETWQACLRTAYDWLETRVEGPILLWGLRLGATLAADLSKLLPELAGLILWQPVLNGENFLNQFLRIKLASEMLAEGKSQIGTRELRQQLASGEAIEVGGYRLAPALAAGIDPLRLGHMPISVPVLWLELTAAGTALSPASSGIVEAWRKTGKTVFTQAIAGEAFWASTEISECPALIDETTLALEKILT
ncbi:MAG: hydrolase 2, exosortase A system-associated [Methylococcaceae bacterium]|nr:hydrolase 2, exosortase A system-associated [Methylococcaceae bacterium]